MSIFHPFATNVFYRGYLYLFYVAIQIDCRYSFATCREVRACHVSKPYPNTSRLPTMNLLPKTAKYPNDLLQKYVAFHDSYHY